jgi:hypothetical protein
MKTNGTEIYRRPHEARLPRRPTNPLGRSFRAAQGHLSFRAWETQDEYAWSSGLLLSTFGGRDALEIWIPWDHKVYNLRETLAMMLQAGGMRPLQEVTIHLQQDSPPLACLLPISFIEENTILDAQATETVDCSRPCWACTKHLEHRTPEDPATWQAPPLLNQHIIKLCCAATRPCWHKRELDDSQTGGIHGPHDHLFCFDKQSQSTGGRRHFHFHRDFHQDLDGTAHQVGGLTCPCCLLWIPAIAEHDPWTVEDYAYVPQVARSLRLNQDGAQLCADESQAEQMAAVSLRLVGSPINFIWLMALRAYDDKVYEHNRRLIQSFLHRRWPPGGWEAQSSSSGASTKCWHMDSSFEGEEDWYHIHNGRTHKSTRDFEKQSRAALRNSASRTPRPPLEEPINSLMDKALTWRSCPPWFPPFQAGEIPSASDRVPPPLDPLTSLPRLTGRSYLHPS